MIVFRADGSNKIGVGHLMRCMTIADAFPDKERVLFVTCSEDSVPILNARGYRAVVLKTYEGKDAADVPIDKELKEFAEVLKENKPSFIMVDSYRATDSYLAELGKICTVGYIDDAGDHKYPVKLLLNYNAFASYDKLDELYETDTMVLVGPDYVPIRKEFKKAKFEIRDEVKNVLVLTGGGDPYNLASKFIAKFGSKDSDGVTYHSVCGFYADEEELKKAAAGFKNIKLYKNVKNIWNLMASCDIAISAGGTTIYELMALGIPVVGYTFADNQHPLMNYIIRKKVFPMCGDYRDKGEELIDDIASSVKELFDKERRENISRVEKSIITGSGAENIRDAIKYCAYKNV
ncbi:MAG: UDP-2,4-diacetamido-2,4,6-trideoxy-beta-L-altropyranose hydrolase [Lachnospiraceae bacterium]|nr:UDP-2,4-diacetamido-2,4,6-trideoxy-beta-L-altropyranose hydrolase [Lachnospiraceae bacterium]